MGTLSREWAISMAFSLVLLLVFGLGLVWLNIERVDLAYELNKMQRQIDNVEGLTAKLEVERNTLITPARLRAVARDYGLGPARPGQIRRVNEKGDVEAAPLVAASETLRATATTRAAARGRTATTARTKARSAQKP